MITQNAWDSQIPVQVEKGGTGRESLTEYAVLCGGTTDKNEVQSVISTGSTNQVLTSNGSSALPSFKSTPSSPGKLLQQVVFLLSSIITYSSVIPYDNSVPQITEGTQIFTTSITPLSVSSNLIFTYSINTSSVTSGRLTIALFQDDISNALVAQQNDNAGSGNANGVSATMIIPSVDTTTRSYHIRIGPHTTITSHVNADFNGNPKYAGRIQSSLLINEIGA